MAAEGVALAMFYKFHGVEVHFFITCSHTRTIRHTQSGRGVLRGIVSETSSPQTYDTWRTLPLLDGGFNQSEIVICV